MDMRTYSRSTRGIVDGVSPVMVGAVHGGKFKRIRIGTGLNSLARWALEHFPVVLGTRRSVKEDLDGMMGEEEYIFRTVKGGHGFLIDESACEKVVEAIVEEWQL